MIGKDLIIFKFLSIVNCLGYISRASAAEKNTKKKYFLVLQVIKTFNQRKNDNLFSSSYHEIFNSLCIELSSIFVSKLRKMSLIL